MPKESDSVFERGSLSRQAIELVADKWAILTLCLLAVMLVAFVAVETLYWREDRGKLRAHGVTSGHGQRSDRRHHKILQRV